MGRIGPAAQRLDLGPAQQQPGRLARRQGVADLARQRLQLVPPAQRQQAHRHVEAQRPAERARQAQSIQTRQCLPPHGDRLRLTAEVGQHEGQVAGDTHQLAHAAQPVGEVAGTAEGRDGFVGVAGEGQTHPEDAQGMGLGGLIGYRGSKRDHTAGLLRALGITPLGHETAALLRGDARGQRRIRQPCRKGGRLGEGLIGRGAVACQVKAIPEQTQDFTPCRDIFRWYA